MTDSYTEVSQQNLLSRIKSSMGGMVFGIALFILAFPLLWLNEGRAINTAKALDSMGQNYVLASADNIDPANNGKLIYLNGQAVTKEVLVDNIFGITQNAIALTRHVEMYQWEETTTTKTEEKLGGTKETTTVYNYNPRWSSQAKDSTAFKIQNGHVNPRMLYQSGSVAAQDVTVGAFKLNAALQGLISSSQKITLNNNHLSELPSKLRQQVKIHEGLFYIGENPNAPQLGDYKISFSVVPSNQQVSILAQQHNNNLMPYSASNDRFLQYLKLGSVGPDEMISQEQSNNTVFTWLLRAMGTFMMFIGLKLIATPLSTLASVVPMLGTLLRAGFGVFALVVSLTLSVLVIAIAWIFYRPLLAIALILAVVACIVAGAKLGKKTIAQTDPLNTAS